MTQDILGFLAFMGLIGFVSTGLLAAVALGRRPAAEVDLVQASRSSAGED